MATKQNNFYLQYQLAAKAGKNADRKAFLRKAAPGAIIVAGCMLAWGGVFLHTAMMRADTRDLRGWAAAQGLDADLVAALNPGWHPGAREAQAPIGIEAGRTAHDEAN